MFKRILIANRGEIAVRVMRACQEIGIQPVAVYSDADVKAMHVRMAAQAVRIGPAPTRESYLDGARIVQAALETGCQAVHPGYGFLSENAEFAEAVLAAGLVFIGPPPSAIRAMGVKTEALRLMQAAGVPTVPGAQGEIDFGQAAEQISYPVLIKAAAGGGGKGMRIVRGAAELTEALESAGREASNAFGDSRLFLEKYLEHARHIEFQVFADSHGNTLHLFERECSVQRRHQKIIEESPSPLLDPALRERMGAAAVEAARAVGYVNAGTIEFIVDAERHFYFLEMNTRLQVEHPVTEWVTGLDLVKLQIRVAAGEALPFQQSDLTQRGHAIECRIYAEDPANGFLPAVGTVTRLTEPSGPGVRVDSGLAAGDEITIHYDPMLAKLSAYGADRADALARMRRALDNYRVEGLTTNIPFLRAILDHQVFVAGQATTDFIDLHLDEFKTPSDPEPPEPPSAPASTSADPWDRADGFRIGGGVMYTLSKANPTSARRTIKQSDNTLSAVMPGQVTKLLVTEGDPVTRGQTLLLLEAMKMEIRVSAPRDGRVVRLHVAQGQTVERGQTLIDLAD